MLEQSLGDGLWRRMEINLDIIMEDLEIGISTVDGHCFQFVHGIYITAQSSFGNLRIICCILLESFNQSIKTCQTYHYRPLYGTLMPRMRR